MNEYLVAEFQKLGVDERNAVLSAQIYLELSEVKKYWNPEYEYIPSLKRVIIKARRKSANEPSIFLPIPSYEKLSFLKLQEALKSCNCESIFLAIVHPDSTSVYYQISGGLAEPTETTAKHLRVNKQEKLDADLRKHRQTIEQAALLGIPITIPRDKPEEESTSKTSHSET